jgi:hypothetical protein
MGDVLLSVLVIGLVVYTVIDVTRSEKDERLGLHPAIWIMAILLFPTLGSIIWIAVSRSVRARPQRSVPTGHKLAPAPLAPDDDPEFLWRLKQRQQEAERDAKRTDRDDGDQDRPGTHDSNH